MNNSERLTESVGVQGRKYDQKFELLFCHDT